MAASNYATAESAMNTLGLENSEDNRDIINVSGQIPSALLDHTMVREFFMTGITAEDFINRHGAADLNLAELQKKFKTICKDYVENVGLDTNSYAVEFCSKIIYKIGPQSRKEDRKKDQLWKMRFLYNINGAAHARTLFVATYRNSLYGNVYEQGRKMCLTVKQAGLLAMDTFDKLSALAYNQTIPLFLLTPSQEMILPK